MSPRPRTPWVSWDSRQTRSSPSGQVLFGIAAIADNVRQTSPGTYEGSVNLEGSLTRMPADILRDVASHVASLDVAVRNLIDLVGTNPVLTATVDSAGRLTSATVRSTVEDVRSSLSIRLSDFGTKIQVAAPPANEVSPAPPDQPAPV